MEHFSFKSCRSLYEIDPFTSSAVPKRVLKKDPRIGPEGLRRPPAARKGSKTDPIISSEIVKMLVPVFLAAPGANLSLSFAFLVPLGAHLASFLPHWAILWPILDLSCAFRAPRGAKLACFMPRLLTILDQLGPILGLLLPISLHPGPSCGQLAASLSHVLAHLVCVESFLNNRLPASTAQFKEVGDVAPGTFYNNSYNSLLKLSQHRVTKHLGYLPRPY